MNNEKFPYHYPQPAQDDEIDLFELATNLWARKRTIIAITVAASLLAVAVALFWPKTWQTEVHLYPASQTELKPLHMVQTKLHINHSSPASMAAIYHRYLTAPSTLYTVFNDSGLAAQALEGVDSSNREATLAKKFTQFTENLKIEKQNEKKTDTDTDTDSYVTITYNSDNQPFSAQLINDFLLPAARTRVVKALTTDLATSIELEKEGLEEQISVIERRFFDNNALQSLVLRDALHIAQAGNISTLAGDRFTNLNSPTEFMLGTQILTSMLKQQEDKVDAYRFLTQPKEGDSNKPLLVGVSPLKIELQDLNSVQLDLDDLTPVVIDRPADIPVAPIKPKKALIVALGTVLGGMLALFVALIQIALANRKEKLRQNTLVPGNLPTSEQAMQAVRN